MAVAFHLGDCKQAFLRIDQRVGTLGPGQRQPLVSSQLHSKAALQAVQLDLAEALLQVLQRNIVGTGLCLFVAGHLIKDSLHVQRSGIIEFRALIGLENGLVFSVEAAHSVRLMLDLQITLELLLRRDHNGNPNLLLLGVGTLLKDLVGAIASVVAGFSRNDIGILRAHPLIAEGQSRAVQRGQAIEFTGDAALDGQCRRKNRGAVQQIIGNFRVEVQLQQLGDVQHIRRQGRVVRNLAALIIDNGDRNLAVVRFDSVHSKLTVVVFRVQGEGTCINDETIRNLQRHGKAGGQAAELDVTKHSAEIFLGLAALAGHVYLRLLVGEHLFEDPANVQCSGIVQVCTFACHIDLIMLGAQCTVRVDISHLQVARKNDLRRNDNSQLDVVHGLVTQNGILPVHVQVEIDVRLLFRRQSMILHTLPVERERNRGRAQVSQAVELA